MKFLKFHLKFPKFFFTPPYWGLKFRFTRRCALAPAPLFISHPSGRRGFSYSTKRPPGGFREPRGPDVRFPYAQGRHSPRPRQSQSPPGLQPAPHAGSSAGFTAGYSSSSMADEPRTFPTMCIMTTKAMNTRLITSTCTGLLRGRGGRGGGGRGGKEEEEEAAKLRHTRRLQTAVLRARGAVCGTLVKKGRGGAHRAPNLFAERRGRGWRLCGWRLSVDRGAAACNAHLDARRLLVVELQNSGLASVASRSAATRLGPGRPP